MITVTAAPPFATIQDLGRPGYRHLGVPVSGVADRDSAVTLNAVLGNGPDAAMIEWAVASGALRFADTAMIAIGGAAAICTLNGKPVDAGRTIEAGVGDELRVEQILRGRFLLIAIRGGIEVPLVLGSRSTLVSAGIGGLEGRRLRTGDTLAVGVLVKSPCAVVNPRRLEFSGAVHVSRGPQAHLFDAHAWTAFLETELTVSRASDRTGYRLEGVTMRRTGSVALPSEPTCIGAIQVPDGGSPIVIMNDGPTVGGYPKIAVIKSAWLSRFAQLAPGDRVRFALDE
jgi:biotin-dependent carboxylase-like uncharacterized protein